MRSASAAPVSAGLPLPWLTPKPPTIVASGFAATMSFHETKQSKAQTPGMARVDHHFAEPNAFHVCQAPSTIAPWSVL